MESDKIKGLEKLLKKYYGDDVEIVDTKLTSLMAPGENYLSDMLKLDVTTRGKNGSESIEHHVAKCVVENPVIPPNWSNVIFKKEIAFYTDIIPAIQQFTKKQGIQGKDLFPKLIATRLNLEDNEEPDENAVLIMENLVEQGYKNADRYKGLDLDGTKLILSDLATFHTVSLAMKILDFDLFHEKIAKNCKQPPPSGDLPINKMNFLRLVAQEDPFFRNHIPKLEKLFADLKEEMENKIDSQPDYTSTFLTLSHNDTWLNNTMQLTKEGQILKNKFVDFQIYKLDHPALDLILFLFTSVDFPTLENHFDNLLMFYHECFIKNLQQYKCDVTPYDYDKFMEKIHAAFITMFIRIIIMNFMIIYCKKGEKADFTKMEELIPSDFHPIAISKFKFLFRKIIDNNLV